MLVTVKYVHEACMTQAMKSRKKGALLAEVTKE